MEKEFEPFHENTKQNEFHPWDLTSPVPEPVLAPPDSQELFQAECQRLREEAKLAGYQEGLAKAASEVELLKSNLSEWIDFFRNPIRLLDKKVSDEIVQTIFWICEACIGLELSCDPQKLLLLVEDIKKELPSIKGSKQLAMNPLDVEWLKNHLDKQKVGAITDILFEDAGLMRGDFYLKGEHTELDGRLKARFTQLFSEQFSMEMTISSDADNSMDDFYDSL
ncbi:polar flagellar assembly protein FliH [Legionella birminghamensis]|uniref:Flagellar assembly protein FliH n=1 Tax=Legionella birminghamensis TaxID=28083 RepID=A0A378IAR9_9GAMM|nr:flagellar assembly protein FliH [Legionella birminghamensis]KTC73085.1 polar flagellar assembly protein FliH [Legionella birminghamensis]STX32338.1 flagellar assembly protein FliH [Legionella birminghamensis]